MEGVELRPIETECGLSRFDVMFLLWDLPEGLRGTVEYSTDLFDDSTIAAMAEAFETLLSLMVGRSDATVELLLRDLDAALVSRRETQAETSKSAQNDTTPMTYTKLRMNANDKDRRFLPPIGRSSSTALS